MRLALVVQRYGLEVRGGAELHCRLIAELLAQRHDVEVVTTCAADYLSWSNVYPRGIDCVNQVPVWRFPVARPRDLDRFSKLQTRVFFRPHSERDAHAWLDEQGPYSPAMRRWIGEHRDAFDFWICFSYRYWTTYHAMRAAAGRAILVPTAEPDPAIDVPIFHPLFRRARAIVFNSPEERDMILARCGTVGAASDVVGVGIPEPPAVGPGNGAFGPDNGPSGPSDGACRPHDRASGAGNGERFRQRFGIDERFVLYVGRIDENKGCRQLFDYYIRAVDGLATDDARPPLLVLAGHAVMEVPEHPLIRHLGTVDEQEKFDALSAASLLVMPSFYESLSMVLLEAWAMGKPVLVNKHCAVLRGQVERSNGGLFYADGNEFIESLKLLLVDERLRAACGAAGRRYFRDNYTWPVIKRKYERLLTALQGDTATASPVAATAGSAPSPAPISAAPGR